MNRFRIPRNPVVTAIDLHPDSAFVVSYNRHDDAFSQERKTRCSYGAEYLFKRILEILNDSPANTTVIVESGSTSRALVLFLRKNGFDARMVKPLKPIDDRPSNDWKDARTLAVDYSVGKIDEIHLLDQATFELREMNRMALSTRRRASDTIRELQSMLHCHTGELFNGLSKNVPTSPQLRELLGNTHALRTAIDLKKQFHLLDKNEKEMRDRITEQLRNNRTYGLLKTIPGVGKALAATIFLETGDIDRFKNAGKFHAFTGLMSFKSYSNKKIKRNHRTAGNSHLKWTFSLAAKRCVEWSSDRLVAPRTFYFRKYDQTHSHKLAQQALASKLAKASFFVMKLQVPFSYERCFGPKLMEKVNRSVDETMAHEIVDSIDEQ